MTTTLADVIDRGDAEFARWAVERLAIDVAAEWPDLDDDRRDWLVSAGVVEEVVATVECTDAESWDSDWRAESGAAWPSYTLSVTAEGLAPLEVVGWHCVGYHGRDYSHSSEWWGELDSDGHNNGQPAVRDWVIESGDNVGADVEIPCWRFGDRWVTLDRDSLGDGRRGDLSDAAATADHGSEPTWEDVTDADLDDDADTVYLLRDGEVADVTLWTGGVAPREEDDCEEDDREGYYGRRRRRYTYGAEAWSHDLTDDTFKTVEHCRRSLADLADDGNVYDTEPKAFAALSGVVYARRDELPDDVTARLDDGVVVLEWALTHDTGVESAEETRLDGADLACVHRHGWAGVLDYHGIAEAAGVAVRPDGYVVYAAGDEWLRLGRHGCEAGTGDVTRPVSLLPYSTHALRLAVVATPADYTAALAYADALDETGEATELATLIRAAVAISEGVTRG